MTQIINGQNTIDQDLIMAKKTLEDLMLKFNKILQDTILPDNKSQGQWKIESDVVMRLLIAANDLDTLNTPEGTYGLITLLIREGLHFRDNFNKMKYDVDTLRQEINKLKMQITDLGRAQR
jgi:hypothetical protein